MAFLPLKIPKKGHQGLPRPGLPTVGLNARLHSPHSLRCLMPSVSPGACCICICICICTKLARESKNLLWRKAFAGREAACPAKAFQARAARLLLPTSQKISAHTPDIIKSVTLHTRQAGVNWCREQSL